MSTHLLNTSRGGDSTTTLGSLFQWSTTLRVKEFFLIPNLNLPWCNLRPFPLMLSQGALLSSFCQGKDERCPLDFSCWGNGETGSWRSQLQLGTGWAFPGTTVNLLRKEDGSPLVPAEISQNGGSETLCKWRNHHKTILSSFSVKSEPSKCLCGWAV